MGQLPFLPQCLERIHARGAARRKIAGERGEGRQYQSGGGEGRRVQRMHLEQHFAHQVRERHGGCRSEHDAGERQSETLPENQQEGGRGRSSQAIRRPISCVRWATACDMVP